MKKYRAINNSGKQSFLFGEAYEAYFHSPEFHLALDLEQKLKDKYAFMFHAEIWCQINLHGLWNLHEEI